MPVRRKSLPYQSEKIVVRRRASLNLFGSNQNVLLPIVDKEKSNSLLRWLKLLVYGNEVPRIQYEKGAIKEEKIVENPTLLEATKYVVPEKVDEDKTIKEKITLIDEEIRQAMSKKETLMIKELNCNSADFPKLKHQDDPINLLVGSKYYVNQLILQVNNSLNIFDEREEARKNGSKLDVLDHRIFENISSLKEHLNSLLAIIKKEEEEEEELKRELHGLQKQIDCTA